MHRTDKAVHRQSSERRVGAPRGPMVAKTIKIVFELEIKKYPWESQRVHDIVFILLL